MSDLLTVALVCASLVNVADCSRDTALDVIVTPAQNPMQCLMQGQAMVAQTGLAAGPDTYVKIACERRRVTAAQLDRPD
jgi:hypothetical protein